MEVKRTGSYLVLVRTPQHPPENEASLSQGLSRPSGGGSGAHGFCLAAVPLGFPALGCSHAGPLGKATKPLSPAEKGVASCVQLCAPWEPLAGVLATQVAW